MSDKMGSYITKLMTTVIDKEQDNFVRDLAWNELNRLGNNISEFVIKNDLSIDKESNKTEQKQEKQLLQEDKNVKNK